MDFQTIRLYGSIAIILGCFIFLYPKLLHPLIMTLFGMGGGNKNNEMDDFVPPPLRNRNPQMADSAARQDIPENIRRSMRHGPHPGMRAAAAEQSKQAKGSGRGMMGIILPMYAVGIVVYLIYTLCKVFNKKDEKSRSQSSPTNMQRTQPARGGGSDDYSEEEGRVSRQSGASSRPTNQLQKQQELKSQLTELQSLASCMVDKDDSEMDMRKLQERLAETEAQMSKILSAMKAVQGKVGDVTTETLLQAEQDLVGMQGNKEDNQATPDKQGTPPVNDSSAESTPDSESYEIINKSNGESNGEAGAATGTPETVGSRASEDVDKNDAEAVGAEDSEGESQNTEETDEGGNGTEDEVEEVLMQERPDDEEDNKTVRKRIPNTDDTQS